ncbi:hypothetical protein M1M40_gp05 [Halorubrum tailed virus 29]|uniref:Uncharacterized protein n=1 Tax=Halorubrum tailed virus 29 TaxID=2878010 RepID=A0AAE9BZB8_9CAUD|nr:hypothetical protein M1M40_gp05 [Halorubrum tailed virus 29]UBF23283.1 hypothetical protein HRTV-29_gp5 [Halorubrum tailed virus 29]
MSDRDRVDDWQVYDPENDNVRAFDARSDAEDARDDMADFGIDVEMYPPGETPADDAAADGGTTGDPGTPAAKAADPSPEPQPDPVEQVPDDPNLTDDPFAWMPGDFVDSIDGTPTINRRGYAALGRKFGISAPNITVHVGPEETDHAYCRVEATVVDDDGREYVNHGSASVDRGDDATLLLELATTRARKRALAGATGVGLIAVEELKNEL